MKNKTYILSIAKKEIGSMGFRISAIAYLLSLTLLIGGSQEKDNNIELNLYAQSAALMDADSGRILYGKNENEVLANASTTKILTCILALEYGNVSEYVQVSALASKMPKVRLGVKEGQYFKLEDLLYSLMLESHNDSAVAIAEHIGGSVEGFASLMNKKAKNIGCTDTYFITPNGLDATDGEHFHSTTAAELSKIMSYCVLKSPKREEFLRICKENSYYFTDYKKSEDGFLATGNNYSVHNKNAFLNMMEGVLAGKTGFTNKAGYCYVAALNDGERNFVVSLLACGWPNNKNYKWSDTKKLFQYGLENFYYKNIVTQIKLPKIEVLGGIPYKDKWVSLYLCDNEKPFEVLLCKEDKVEVKVYLPKQVMAPINKNEKVGMMKYYLNDEVIKICEIRAQEEVREHTFSWSLNYVCQKWIVS